MIFGTYKLHKTTKRHAVFKPSPS